MQSSLRFIFIILLFPVFSNSAFGLMRNLSLEQYSPATDSIVHPDSLLFKKLEIMNDELHEMHKTMEELQFQSQGPTLKKKNIHFGLSLGYRWLTKPSSAEYTIASVSPIDSTLRLTQLERTSYLFSTSIIFDLHLLKNSKQEIPAPILEKKYKKRRTQSFHYSKSNVRPARTHSSQFLYKFLDKLCIVSNLNILDFTNGQKELAFNKSIEGGLGIGYQLNDTMYIGFNWEHIKSYQLHIDIKEYEGKKIKINGDQLVNSSQLDLDNEDIFYQKNLNGWGFKLIICF